MAKEEADEQGLTDPLADFGDVGIQVAVSEQLAESTMQISQDMGFRFSENKTIKHSYTFFLVFTLFFKMLSSEFFSATSSKHIN